MKPDSDGASPCIGERYRDTLLDMHGSGIASLGAARLRLVANNQHDEAVVVDSLVSIAHRRGSTVTELEAAKAEALAELRQGRSIAWALTVGRTHLPILRARKRRPLATAEGAPTC